MASKLQELVDAVISIFTERSKALRGTGEYLDSFEDKKSQKEVISLFDRKDYVEKLKKLDSDDFPMSDWVESKSSAEFMAGLERDTRERQKSRLDHYRAAVGSKNLVPLFYKRYAGIIDGLKKT